MEPVFSEVQLDPMGGEVFSEDPALDPGGGNGGPEPQKEFDFGNSDDLGGGCRVAGEPIDCFLAFEYSKYGVVVRVGTLDTTEEFSHGNTSVGREMTGWTQTGHSEWVPDDSKDTWDPITLTVTDGGGGHFVWIPGPLVQTSVTLRPLTPLIPQNSGPKTVRPDLPDWVRDFYKKHQGQIDRCINRVFGQLWDGTPDIAATTMGRQTIKNAPELDATISQGVLSVYTGDPAVQGTFSLAGNLGHGTVYIASNLYGSISQDERNRTYFHEVGNILAAQITGDIKGSHFGNPNGIGKNYKDPDTGARLEKCIFGSVPF